MAAAAIALIPGTKTLPATMINITRRLNLRSGSPAIHSIITSCSYSSSSASKKQLILYSKPGCCLCDGLKEKLHSAFSLSSPSPDSFSLHDVELQIRDITSNPEWETTYQYEIPVLARFRSDGTEVCVLYTTAADDLIQMYEILWIRDPVLQGEPLGEAVFQKILLDLTEAYFL